MVAKVVKFEIVESERVDVRGMPHVSRLTSHTALKRYPNIGEQHCEF